MGVASTELLDLWTCTGVRRIGRVCARYILVLLALPMFSVVTNASVKPLQDRPRVVAWLDQSSAKVGEQLSMLVEVTGPVSVDVYLGKTPSVPGLQFLPSSGPVASIRTDTVASGNATNSYVATFTIPIRVFSGGRYEITPPPVIAPDESEWSHGPLILLAEGPSSVSSRQDPSLQWILPSESVFAGERVRVGLRLEVDAQACPLEGRTFSLPWWGNVIALRRSSVGGKDPKWAVVEGADHRVALHQDEEVSGRRVFLGAFDVLATDAGTIALGGSSFTAAPAGTFSALDPASTDPLIATSNDAGIEVLPLPMDGRPLSFVDLVGEFDVRASLDRDHLAVGDPLTLTVEVLERGGATNLPYAQVVSRPDWPGFRSEGEPSYVTESGLCQIRFTFAPESASAQIPDLSVSWFRPGERAFETKRLGPFPVRIDERGSGSSPMDGEDSDLSGELGWWLTLPIVLMLIVGWSLGLRRGRQEQGRRVTLGEAESAIAGTPRLEAGDEPQAVAAEPDSGDRAGSNKAAVQFDAEREESESRGVREGGGDLGASKALAKYIGRRTGSPPAACFGPGARDRLRGLGIDEDLAGRVVEFFDVAERRAFSELAAAELADAEKTDAVTWGWEEAARLVVEIERERNSE